MTARYALRAIIPFISGILLAPMLVFAQPQQASNQVRPSDPDKWLFLDQVLTLPTQTQADVLRRTKESLRRIDRNRDGLTLEEIEEVKRRNHAKAQDKYVKRLLTFDLNRDGIISRKEVEQRLRVANRVEEGQAPAPYVAKIIEKHLTTYMNADTNNDQVIDRNELLANFEETYRQRPGHRMQVRVWDLLFESDPNADGRITYEELPTLIDQAFKRRDLNRDGIVDKSEHAEITKRLLALSDPKSKSCKIPRPTEKEEIVVLGTYGGEKSPALQTDSLGENSSQYKVTIEPGDRPIYILLTSEAATDWHLEGDVQRVSRVIIIQAGINPKVRSTITGLDKNRAQFALPGSCPTVLQRTNGLALPMITTFDVVLGRRPENFIRLPSYHPVRLPSGQMQ